MPHTWTRLHEHLGALPGPVDFAMIKRCVADQLPEADDLDWKEDLPNTQDPKESGEFSKDVTAMANTRGGLIVYGVIDKPIAFKGIRAEGAKPDQYAQWVRNQVQPYLAGLDMHVLASDDGTEAVLVVDVPASELAPHSVAFDNTLDRAKSQFASVTPYRDGPHTAWMAEHQIARAYTDRFTRSSQWEAAFNELNSWLSDMLAARSDAGHAWLLLVARPARPIPRAAPKLTKEDAKAIVDDACKNPLLPPNNGFALQYLDGYNGYISVGLNSWIITNQSPDRMVPRHVYVELHHDGSVAFAIDVTEQTLREPFPVDLLTTTSVVNLHVVERAFADLEALLLTTLRVLRIDSPIRLRTSIISDPELPAQCAIRDFGSYVISSSSRRLPRVRPVDAELPAGATEDMTKATAADLASGILNQFGLVCQVSRYTT